MLLRGRSEERERKVTPPGPVYMSNQEFGEYLKNLRDNRVSRPAGARPLPSTIQRDLKEHDNKDPRRTQKSDLTARDEVRHPANIQSYMRAHSSLSTYSSVSSRTGRQLVQQPVQRQEAKPLLKPSDVVPSATYMERGQRWMEKEDASSLRDAMDNMDISKEENEEARIHAAAQDEASELVWQHEYPRPLGASSLPYRYKDHLRKNSYQHARTQSVGRYSGFGISPCLAKNPMPRSASGSSNESGGKRSPAQETQMQNSNPINSEASSSPPSQGSKHTLERFEASRKSYGSIPNRKTNHGPRRRSSTKRNISGEVAEDFTGEQIWEEVEPESVDHGQQSTTLEMPAPLCLKSHNPLNRLQSTHELEQRSRSTPPEPIKRLSSFDIYMNPPTQSRNPNYTANAPLLKRSIETVAQDKAAASTLGHGLEIRSDDIRQATSMRLKDRSAKLPTPTVVSDKPGRPIVSFDLNWKPKDADTPPEVRRRSPFDRRLHNTQRQSFLSRTDSAPVPVVQAIDRPTVRLQHASTTPITTITLPDDPCTLPRISLSDKCSSTPSVSLPEPMPSIPTIILPESVSPIPTIVCPDTNDSVPVINLPDSHVVTVGPSQQTKRPLPIPKSSTGQNIPHSTFSTRSHWSPAAGRRATVTCRQCDLPIEGRVVKLGGAQEHFHPECFICFSCGTGLESLEIHPEPASKRIERIDRIRRRTCGESVPEVEGQTLADDGNGKQRFYCHLDFHENFAPRCKHCKTPIIGEHTVALGEHWHYGHFFCAECGDPFEKGMTHIEKDGYAWCLNCQTRRTERQAPKCKKCRLPVIGEYVRALGGEWHEKCFRCVTCRNGFEDGAFYPKETGNETIVLCVTCIERELKA